MRAPTSRTTDKDFDALQLRETSSRLSELYVSLTLRDRNKDSSTTESKRFDDYTYVCDLAAWYEGLRKQSSADESWAFVCRNHLYDYSYSSYFVKDSYETSFREISREHLFYTAGRNSGTTDGTSKTKIWKTFKIFCDFYIDGEKLIFLFDQIVAKRCSLFR